ncbi:unnamed protein product [Strongylus vulgaris]|uniref:Protein kinase domain-containing protein n=1 Tax=Strongylus vulgaris TaxID=40348 RepID=A0A3P7JFW1_STRVU|nr:unnamed protein product [Strongylus vulgaris]
MIPRTQLPNAIPEDSEGSENDEVPPIQAPPARALRRLSASIPIRKHSPFLQGISSAHVIEEDEVVPARQEKQQSTTLRKVEEKLESVDEESSISPNRSRAPSSTYEFPCPRLSDSVVANMIKLSVLSEGRSRFGIVSKYINKTTMANYAVAEWDIKAMDRKVSHLLLSGGFPVLSEGRSRFGIVSKYINKTTMANYAVVEWDIKAMDRKSLDEVICQLEFVSTLRHPRIGSVYGYYVTDSRLQIFRTFLPSGAVADQLKLAPLPEITAMKYFKQSLEALNFLHERGVVHGDIKSKYFKQSLEALNFLHERGVVHGDIKTSNLLITLSGDIQVTDISLPRE